MIAKEDGVELNGRIRELLRKNPKTQLRELAYELYKSDASISASMTFVALESRMYRVRDDMRREKTTPAPAPPRKIEIPPPARISVISDLSDVDELLLSVLRKSKRQHSISDLSHIIDRSEKTVRLSIDKLRELGHNMEVSDDGAILSETVRPGAAEPLILHPMDQYKNNFRIFGACGDNHLGSKHSRLDVLNALYDIYADEGITEVFNTGNWIEGEAGKMNFHDIDVFGLDDQVQYFIENYPQREGITTYFIAGDDHEGWYQKRERIEIGRYAEMAALRAGRTDLKYLGYQEADVELRAANGSRIMKVIHPGGGSAYALSYSVQKYIEALQGGEKPGVVLVGHYHKFDFNYYREVYSVQTGTTCDQSLFMRKQKIQAHVGGCIIRLNQADDGRINRFQCEWIPFYDRGFYVKHSL